MIAAFQFEANNYRSISLGTPKAQSLSVNGIGAGSPAGSSSDDDKTALFEFGSSVQTSGVAKNGELNGDTVEALKDSFADFCANVSTIGGNESNAAIPAAPVCDPVSTISATGEFAISPMTKAIRDAFSSFASFFGPDANQASRIVFTGFVIASAALRALFPLVKEALANVPDGGLKLAFTIVSFSLAAIHLLISTLTTVIATNNTPAILCASNDEAVSKSMLEKLADGLVWLFSKAEDTLVELSQQGLVTWLGTLREWLLTSAAVIGFIAVLPLLIKTVATIISAPVAAIVGGSISLAASILEAVQGSKERNLLGEELKILKEKAGDSPTAEQAAAIDEKTRALLASNIRFAKGLVGILTSVASIVLGTLAIAASIAVPCLPAVLTAISLLSVVVYAAITFAFRDMRKQEIHALDSTAESSADNAAPPNDVLNSAKQDQNATQATSPAIQPLADSGGKLSDIITYFYLAMMQLTMTGNA